MTRLPNPKVLIVGCGIAGPVLALLLKKKGYDPIIVEKVRELGDAGGSLMIYPNGLKVLSLVNLSDFVTSSTPHLSFFQDQTSRGEVLGGSSIPSTFVERYGYPGVGIKRAALNLKLKEAIREAGIPVYEGWKLEKIVEKEDGITAVSEDGRSIEGSFVVGCDGIKAVSRSLVLNGRGVEEEKADYTGLIQTAAMSPTPPSLANNPGMLQIYGPAAHIISYPVSASTTSWAITQRDTREARETWRLFTDSEIADHRVALLEEFKDWCSPVAELIEGATRILRYGIYDRPQLEPEQWFSAKGRVVLVGDAAHPTSPHLGQGANQALEDCYHLTQKLPDNPSDEDLSSGKLREIFNAFASQRQPRTAALVRGARLQGESRVIDGGREACAERDEGLRKAWEDEKVVDAKYDALFREPF